MKKTLKDCIINSENAPALAVVREQFGNWLDATLPGYMEESFTPQDRLNVVYNSDKVTFLESFIGTNGMAGITGSLVKIPGLTGLSYSNTIIGAVNLGVLNPAILQYVNTPSPQNIDTDTLWLAEHHLYGSSRLGIKQYAPHQYRNVYSNTQTFVKGINVKQPWYSGLIEEEIKSGVKSLPLLSAHYLVDSFRYKRDLGTKYYELSDHLGNVLATVLDRKTGYGAAAVEYSGFKADVASATDYYPFGMEILGRTIDNNSYRFGFNTQEKTDEIAGKGNHNTALFWEYDTRTGRRWNVDPMAHVREWVSPYSAMQDNPINRFDPIGALDGSPDNYVFNEDGKYVRTEENDKPDKLVVENSRTKARKDYDFNDPKTDVAAIKYNIDKFGKDFKNVKFIFHLSKPRINEMMKESGVEDMNYFSRRWFVASESVGGTMDFTVFHLSTELAKDGEGKTWNFDTELMKDKGPIFLITNQRTAYNLFDAGNWLWGNAVHRIGGTQINAREWSTKYNREDSPADQRAIQGGWWYQEGYQNVLDCPENR